MILFLSTSFLERLHLIWKPSLKAFLIGSRNLFFFTPDLAVEVETIAADSVDLFLQKTGENGNWELLGFLAAGELPAFPGYVHLNTAGTLEPSKWKAQVCVLGVTGPELKELEIRLPSGRA